MRYPEQKGLRWRSLAAFLMPLLFAVWMLHPTPLGRLADLEQPPVVTEYGAPQRLPRQISSNAALAALLADRWCVRVQADDLAALSPGDLQVAFGAWSLLLQADRQYLTHQDGATYQIPGQALRPAVEALLTP